MGKFLFKQSNKKELLLNVTRDLSDNLLGTSPTAMLQILCEKNRDLFAGVPDLSKTEKAQKQHRDAE